MKSVKLASDKASGIFLISAPESDFTQEGAKLVSFPRPNSLREFKLKVGEEYLAYPRGMCCHTCGCYFVPMALRSVQRGRQRRSAPSFDKPTVALSVGRHRAMTRRRGGWLRFAIHFRSSASSSAAFRDCRRISKTLSCT
jgi:hypothetical protein